MKSSYGQSSYGRNRKENSEFKSYSCPELIFMDILQGPIGGGGGTFPTLTLPKIPHHLSALVENFRILPPSSR